MRLLAVSLTIFIFEACMLFSVVKSEEITAEARQDSGSSILPSFISSWLYGDDEPSAEYQRRPRHAQRQRGGGPMPHAAHAPGGPMPPFRRPIPGYAGRSFPQQRPFSAAAVAAPSHRVNRQVVAPVPRRPLAGPIGGPGRVTPPLSLKGWVSYPTPRPLLAHPSPPGNKRPVRSGKNGVCGAPASYGIECSGNMDQCSTDAGCPGNTMCCIVASCGQMCVKGNIKGSSANGQQSVSASSVLKKQVKRENEPESSTMSSGLKQTDVIKNVHRSKTSVQKKRSPLARNMRFIRGFGPNPAMRNRMPSFRFRG